MRDAAGREVEVSSEASRMVLRLSLDQAPPFSVKTKSGRGCAFEGAKTSAVVTIDGALTTVSRRPTIVSAPSGQDG